MSILSRFIERPTRRSSVLTRHAFQGVWLFLSLAGAWGAVVEDAPRLTLNGSPAPPASATAGGVVLVARQEGPQVLFSERPRCAFVALESGEQAEIIVPLRPLAQGEMAEAEVRLLEGTEATVEGWIQAEGSRSPSALSSTAKASRLKVTTGEAKVVSIPVPAGATNLALHLRAAAAGSTATVLWRQVRLSGKPTAVNLPISPRSRDADICPPPVLPALRPALEPFLVEMDWRLQDGIDTERVPSTYAEAVAHTLERAQALVEDLEAQGLRPAVPPTRWAALRQEFHGLRSAGSTDETGWENLWRKVHQARRELALANPLLGRHSIAFVKQAPSMFSHQLTQYYGSCLRPGGGVFVLDQPGRSMRARCLTTQVPLGSFQHVEVSPDGKRLLFCYCPLDSTPKDREEHLERFCHLYEMGADGSGLKQLTEGPFDDFSPRYLPSGGIIFISTRRGGFHRCGRGPCPVYTLCVANGDGSNPQPVSWHETHEWDPVVLHDGRIVYTRWDYVDRHAVYYEQLWSARPDGTGVRIFYGNNTFNPVGIWEAQAVPGSRQIMATAAAHHAMTAGSIILVDPAQAPDGPGPITRLTPDALFPESEAPVVLKPNGAWSAPAGLTGPTPAPPEAARWPGHCYRSPLPLSEKHFLAAYSFEALIGEPTWNRANMFGLYLVDAFGNKELLYRDLNIASLWPRLLRAETPPPSVAGPRERDTDKEGLFFLQNVHTSWPALPQEPITHLRIVQILPKSTPHANAPTVGLANASPGKQVLGTVPVEADGSAFFRAPANVPLAFQALDAQGQAVQIMRSVVYLQAGEVASCVGCHDHRTTAPPQERQVLALSRPASNITPGPDGSRPLSYVRLVQPVLDRHCVRCHNSTRPDGKVLLTGEPQGAYTVSYNVLAPRVSFSSWGSKDGDFRKVNSEPATHPGFFGARGSPAIQKYLAGHYDVVLPPEDRQRLNTWMDANALFYGTFSPQDQARQQRGELIAGPAVQ